MHIVDDYIIHLLSVINFGELSFIAMDVKTTNKFENKLRAIVGFVYAKELFFN